jgi:hypothetical protein
MLILITHPHNIRPEHNIPRILMFTTELAQN